MNEIDKNTRIVISNFYKRLILEHKNKSTIKRDLYLSCGKYYNLYRNVFKSLRSEFSLEYLKSNELNNALSDFTFEVISEYSDYRGNELNKELNKKIDVFLSNISRPVEEYEVLIPILNLNANDFNIEIGDVVVKKFDDIVLEEWGIQKDTKLFEEIVNKIIAIIPEKGNNPELVYARARRKADFVIRVLQVSISTNNLISDQNTLFKQDENVCYRKKDNPSSIRCQRRMGYEPFPLHITDDQKENINKFLSSVPEILEQGKLSAKLRKRFRRALIWTGRSIEEQDPDIKIIFLSTALEAILSTKDEGKKGETLAYRMLLLHFYVNMPVTDPATVLSLYELRSDIVHGSDKGIASHYHYLIMKQVVIETLQYSLKKVLEEGLTKHNDFIKAIEHDDQLQKAKNWLEKRGDKISSRIIDQINKQLSRKS